MNETREEEDLKLMKDPSKWAMWPALPLKRRRESGRFPELGLLLDGQGPVVFMTCLFEIPEDFSKVEKKEYKSLEAVVQDGWIVD